MKIPEVKRLVEHYSLEELANSEEAILNETTPPITINGEDEGEQLTHVMAAIWCKKTMQNENLSLKDAIREYTIRVRTSIN